MVKFEGVILYESNEIAKKFKVSNKDILNLLQKKKLKGRQIGNKWFVPSESILKYFGISNLKQEEDLKMNIVKQAMNEIDMIYPDVMRELAK